jgi:hypothetical protein
MINTDSSELHSKPTRKMRDAAMLLLLRRPLRDAVTFCAFEKIGVPTTAEKRRQKQVLVCGKGGFV